jgi:flagellar hook-associated protein FlgK
VQTANNAIADIAKINQQLGAAPADSATALLEDQRDQDVAQLSKLMNVTVVRGGNNQISVYTGTGQQLVSGVNASTLSFDNVGTMTPTALWSANPSQDQAGTITVTTTSGTKTDLVAEGAIQSGEIGAYLQTARPGPGDEGVTVLEEHFEHQSAVARIDWDRMRRSIEAANPDPAAAALRRPCAPANRNFNTSAITRSTMG